MSAVSKNPIGRNIATVERDRADQIEGQRQGQPSLFTCPECSGTLWQVGETEVLLFRCHVGHVLTAEALLHGQAVAAENSLWYTIRTLSDRMVLARQLAEYARKEGDEEAARGFEELARLADEKAQALRQITEI